MACLRISLTAAVVLAAVTVVHTAKLKYSLRARQQQCPLRQEILVKDGGQDGGQRVMMVPIFGGLGAAAARNSCISHASSPLFLNTQEDADILHRLLKDCVKAGLLSSVWVPARRHLELKRIDRPTVQSKTIPRGNVEYDWMSAHYNRTSDDITLLPFPKHIHERKGIICLRRN